jgi:hypothetical protein
LVFWLGKAIKILFGLLHIFSPTSPQVIHTSSTTSREPEKTQMAYKKEKMKLLLSLSTDYNVEDEPK